MGDCLILNRRVSKIKFDNIIIKEIDTMGYSTAYGSNLTWTATEDCTVICVGSGDTSSRGYNAVSISGSHSDCYKNTSARFFCYVGELSSGAAITVPPTPYGTRMLVKISAKHLQVELLNLNSKESTGGDQVIDALVGTTSKSGTITPKKGDAYLLAGALGYHDVNSPDQKGISLSFDNCERSYITRGRGTDTSNGGNGEPASSVTSTNVGWSAVGVATCVLNSDSSAFQMKSYLYNSYTSGSYTAVWAFKILKA